MLIALLLAQQKENLIMVNANALMAIMKLLVKLSASLVIILGIIKTIK